MKKQSKTQRGAESRLQPIEMPKNTPIGFVIAFFATVMGFAFVWHIWWMAILGLIGLFGAILIHGWRVSGEVEVPIEALAAVAGGRTAPGAEP
jgi:cytochrome o ubiquinol oxidase subunit 1